VIAAEHHWTQSVRYEVQLIGYLWGFLFRFEDNQDIDTNAVMIMPLLNLFNLVDIMVLFYKQCDDGSRWLSLACLVPSYEFLIA